MKLPPTRVTVIPADPDDLICDTCPERYPSQGDVLRTFESARVKGWHIYQNVMIKYSRGTGERDFDVDTRILCPKCVGTPRSQLPPAPTVLEGQADILEDLNIHVEPVEKEKKPKKGIN
jgi:hypothetical protein